MIYRLEGIPQEYYKYCLSIDGKDLSVESLSRAMQEGINMPYNECIELGESARDFVVKNKNAQVQCEKILDLINELQS